MKNQIETRLKELHEEYQKGQNQLTNLEQETAGVRESMLRISGAIQILQELLQEKESASEKVVSNGDLELS